MCTAPQKASSAAAKQELRQEFTPPRFWRDGGGEISPEAMENDAVGRLRLHPAVTQEEKTDAYRAYYRLHSITQAASQNASAQLPDI